MQMEEGLAWAHGFTGLSPPSLAPWLQEVERVQQWWGKWPSGDVHSRMAGKRYVGGRQGEDHGQGVLFKGGAAVAHFSRLHLTSSKVPLPPKVASPASDQTLTT